MVMDENFAMPQFNRTRRIWLYLPPDYETSGKNYPVLYMNDGQNLFDAATSFAGEWEVDETLNYLYNQGREVPIVVGIDNGGEYRIGEYTPWPHIVYGGGEGDLYMQFIIQTLKPFIDEQYRTLPGREYTGIMGSSLGGLISHYGALQYPEVFSKAGIFSPSYWWSASVWPFTSGVENPGEMQLYLMCGGNEGQGTINNMLNMQDTLLAAGFGAEEISTKVIPGGQHNESLWRQDFGEAYLWLFGSYAFGVQEQPQARNILFFPNPAMGMIQLPVNFPISCDSLEILDMMGRRVWKVAPFSGHDLDVSQLPKGLYIVSLNSAGVFFQGKFLKK
jgi:predicted alpha/beta superfamily hydrolase